MWFEKNLFSLFVFLKKKETSFLLFIFFYRVEWWWAFILSGTVYRLDLDTNDRGTVVHTTSSAYAAVYLRPVRRSRVLFLHFQALFFFLFPFFFLFISSIFNSLPARGRPALLLYTADITKGGKKTLGDVCSEKERRKQGRLHCSVIYYNQTKNPPTRSHWLRRSDYLIAFLRCWWSNCFLLFFFSSYSKSYYSAVFLFLAFFFATHQDYFKPVIGNDIPVGAYVTRTQRVFLKAK